MSNDDKLSLRDEYFKLIEVVELERILLTDLHVTRKSDKLGACEANLGVDFGVESISDDSLTARGNFHLEVFHNDPENRIELFNIEICYILEYSLSEKIDLSDPIKERFANKNVPVNCWPYARELISSLTTRMGYPALVIKAFKA